MLNHLFRRSQPVQLRFEQRECVIVPQTQTYFALHADVHFAAAAPEPAVIADAQLRWDTVAGGRTAVFRRTRWDRAVVEGRFRYPPQSLEIVLAPEPRVATITFNDPLIAHGLEPMPDVTLVLELTLQGRQPLQTRLWRVAIAAWDRPAEVTWVAG